MEMVRQIADKTDTNTGDNPLTSFTI